VWCFLAAVQSSYISDCEASVVSVDVRDLGVESYAGVSAIESCWWLVVVFVQI
jgi:hypothetical protein